MTYVIYKPGFLNVNHLNIRVLRAAWGTSVCLGHIHSASSYRWLICHSFPLISSTSHSPVHTSATGTMCPLGLLPLSYHLSLFPSPFLLFHGGFLSQHSFWLWTHFDPAVQRNSLCCFQWIIQLVDKSSASDEIYIIPYIMSYRAGCKKACTRMYISHKLLPGFRIEVIGPEHNCKASYSELKNCRLSLLQRSDHRTSIQVKQV